MAVAKKKKRASKAQRSPEKYLESSVRIVEGAGILGARPRPFSYESAIQRFRSWVYAAIMLNANAVAATPLRMYVKKRSAGRRLVTTRSVPHRRRRFLLGDDTGPLGRVHPDRNTVRKLLELGDDFEEVVSHPLLDLLQSVNPWHNGFDLIQLLAIYLESVGNAYWHPVLNGLGVPGELWPMPSQWVFVKPSRETLIEGYVYGRDASTWAEFTPDEVIHFRTANPGRDGLYYGMGKIEAGWPVISLNESTHEMDLAFSDNHARPDYIVIVKQGGTKDSLDRFEERVERKLKGNKNTGRFLAMTGEVDVKELNFPPKDLAGREDIVEEIAAVIGTPVSLLKSNDPNLASARTGFASWKENSTLPMTCLIGEKLNERLVPLFGLEGEALLAFDNPVPSDKEFELREDMGLVTVGIKTRAEVREARGLPPVDGADELLVTSGLMPVDDVGQQPFGGGGFPMRLPGSQRPALPSPESSPEQRQSKMWLGKQGTQEDLPAGGAAEGFLSEMRSLLEDMSDSAQRSVLGGPSEVERALSDARWAFRFERAARPFVEEAIELGGRFGSEKVGLVSFDVQNPEVQRFVDRWTVRLADQAVGHVRVQLSSLIGDGLSQGESPQQLAQRVREWAAVNDPSRGVAHLAERIARTESARAYAAGEIESWQQSGQVAGKQWLLSPDPCEFCQALANEFKTRTIGLNEPFYALGHQLRGTKGGTMKLDYSAVTGPPLHPHCRCDLIPVLSDS